MEVQLDIIQIGPAHGVWRAHFEWSYDFLSRRISKFRNLKRSDLFKHQSVFLVASAAPFIGHTWIISYLFIFFSVLSFETFFK